MSLKTTSTALAAILALGAAPVMAQDAADSTDTAAKALEQSVEQTADSMKDSATDAVAKAGAEVEAAADSAMKALDDAQESVDDAAKEVDSAADTAEAEQVAKETKEKADEAAAEAAKTADPETDAPVAHTATDSATTAPATDAASTTTPTTDPAAPAADAAAPAADASAAPAADAASQPAATATTPAATDAASTEPQLGAYYVKSTHDDWTLRCIKTDTGADPCELYQLLKGAEGVSVAEMTLIPLENGGKAVAGATIVAPLETDLLHGIGFKVDSGEQKGYPFNFCAPVGCVSRIGFTADEIAALKRGAKATVSLLPYGAQAEKGDLVNLDVSLKGFTAAYDALVMAVDDMKKMAGDAQRVAPAEVAPTE